MVAKTNKTVVGIAIQPTPGTFVQPGAGDYIAVSPPTNRDAPITAEDPSLNGTLDANPRVLLGQSGEVSATVPLRGWNSGTLPAANAFVLGRVIQSVGFTELRNATPITGTAQAGGDTDTIILAGSESSSDDFYNGMVIQHAGIGTALRGYAPIIDYAGDTKAADLNQLLAAAVEDGTYTLPAQLSYVLGAGGGPLLSISVWRDNRRFDYEGCSPSTFRINLPTAGREGGDLPSVEFGFTGNPLGSTDQASPAITQALLQPVPPFRAGKFHIDRKALGGASVSVDLGATSGFAPNANMDSGSESAELLSRTRTVSLDLNSMLRTEWDYEALVAAQSNVPMSALWGLGVGNRFALSIPSMILDPLAPGDRGGFVNLTGDAFPNGVNRSICLSIF